jgi:hypothetical protein
MPKIFGRNPAAYAGLVAAIVMVLTQIPQLGLSVEAGAAITAFVSALLAVYSAFQTHMTGLAVFTGAAQAFFVLLAAFSLNVSDSLQTSIIATIPVVFALFQHTQSIPVEGDQVAEFDLTT